MAHHILARHSLLFLPVPATGWLSVQQEMIPSCQISNRVPLLFHLWIEAMHSSLLFALICILLQQTYRDILNEVIVAAKEEVKPSRVDTQYGIKLVEPTWQSG